MSENEMLKEILDYAIDREEEAKQTYEAAAEMVKDATMRDALLEMAAQESGHATRLRNIDPARLVASSQGRVPNLKIADYVVPGEFHPGLTYPELLTLAMNREKAAFRLYTDLARETPDPEAKALFKALAQEEARHKLSFEIEYDNNVLQEN